MKKRFSLLSLTILLSVICFGQSKEIVYSSFKNTTTNYYVVYKPAADIKGVLVLLPGFMETPEQASVETEIQNVAVDKGLITIIPTLQHGTNTFYLDEASQATLDSMINVFLDKYSLKSKPFYIGGFSLGGSGAVKYAERAYSSTTLPKPKAVFAIDPPLDLERWYNSKEQTIRLTKNAAVQKEAEYFVKRLNYELKTTPKDNNQAYQKMSPFSHSDFSQANIKNLVNCPVRLISEPDILWQMDNRDGNLFDLNALDCSAAINALKVLGNNNAVLIVTNNKGYRKATSERNPHSWSIADANETISWLLNFK